MLSLAALDLTRLRGDGITWGRGIVVSLCILLGAFGWFEQQDGLENARIPTFLRFDRL